MQNDPLVQVQVDESEDTEWNDILRQKGVIPERPPSPTAALEEALDEALKKQHDNRLEDKNLSDLDELEDEEDEDFLNMYKQKRLKEMAKLQEKSKFGEVFEINKPDYHKEITLASMGNAEEGKKTEYLDAGDEDKENGRENIPGVYVFVHLSLQSKLQSRILSNLFRILAPKYPEIKFVEIACNRAIENYPESNCPTVLVYYKGEVVKSLVTLLELGGNDTNLSDFEQFMVRVGALDEKDGRLIMNQDDEESREARKLEFAGKGIRSGIKNKFNIGTGAISDEEDDDFFD
ncbi:probable Phosducin-like protein 2 [Zygosaccharomyces bailii ISA1307]|uniref:BN860_02388g1_1 n=1 Tax=Zygosaccharomyces bailii (strain CLIB 213 / ATCC 58445 / CBS 680 / BCRC 21525 / NBRC 1098 / NCYC 1416 / NRRL Y-2227) TaxID=1333698 RepID=A0A8J2T1M4_ZYGB2|nr:BN860_02388g1_1 [Zygosaccharomyces bailii CLIB 213]CDH15673.1 probable Phosducin-like protein 2 [Zygosaccharomyces bailii ISA1307]